MEKQNALLHDIMVLERKLHGIITQRECLGVNSKETVETEGELKRALADKKQQMRAIMEQGESPSKQPPRQPALIKNGLSLEMLPQIMEIEDKLCSILPVIETRELDPHLLFTLTGPTIVNDVPDDGIPNRILHPDPSSSSPSPSLIRSSSSPSPSPSLNNNNNNNNNNNSNNSNNSNNTTATVNTTTSPNTNNRVGGREGREEVEARFAACSFSTYPHVPEGAGSGRQGDPICDRFCVQVRKNNVVVALADGCNWGRLPFEAANKAMDGFVGYLESRIQSVTSLRGAGSLLLAAMSAANKKITDGIEPWQCGTTTLIGGMLLPNLSSHAPPIGSLPRSSSWSSSNSLSNLTSSPGASGRVRAGSTSQASNNHSSKLPASSISKWTFVCVSLGDCKAFHYSQRTQQFTDITEGNRQNLTDARDPGGRLGPYLEDEPDLRNLHLYYHIAEPGDLILLMSDGVHDNLDPQQLGVPPPETNTKKPETWEEAEKLDPERVESFKNSFRKGWLEDTFSKQLLMKERENSPGKLTDKLKLDVKTVVEVLSQHCVNITKSSREFMEQNPKLKLPPDFKLYPGKLDHTTCVCFKVGTNDN